MIKQLKKTLKRILRLIIIILSPYSVHKRLGYKWNTRLLIIHADDLGLTGPENEASVEALEKGMVNSGSIMVPCQGFEEIAEYARHHTEADLGVHLTITSEWESFRWKPVLPFDEVSSLTDGNGFFLESSKKISENAIAEEVEKEFRAQINRALDAGINLTHLDTHMFSAFANKTILDKYIAIGKEYRLPVLLTRDLPRSTLNNAGCIKVDKLYYAEPQDYKKGLGNFYSKALRSLKPGLNIIIIHVAYDNNDMRKITGDNINYGSSWRQADLDFFTGEECRGLIEKKNVQLITWREIREKLILNNSGE